MVGKKVFLCCEPKNMEQVEFVERVADFIKENGFESYLEPVEKIFPYRQKYVEGNDIFTRIDKSDYILLLLPYSKEKSAWVAQALGFALAGKKPTILLFEENPYEMLPTDIEVHVRFNRDNPWQALKIAVNIMKNL